MSGRLTNDIRRAIADAMIKHRFSDEAADLIADQRAFALAVYDDIYKRKDRDAMAALPDGWLPTIDRISVFFGGQKTVLNLNGTFWVASDFEILRPAVESVERRVPFSHWSERKAHAYDAGHRLSERFSKIESRMQKFVEDCRAANRQVLGALGKAGTIKSLCAAWPEATPFCAPFDAARPQLPAVPVAQLNRMLGLPVEDAVT